MALARPILFLFLLLSFSRLSAQWLDYRQGELIVQFTAEQGVKDWVAHQPQLDGYRPLGRSLNTFLLRFDFTRHSEAELRDRFRADPSVIHVQLNRRVGYRRRPDDPGYPQQWQMRNTGQTGGVAGADYNVEAAWDVATGGVTPNGDTIVIAVIDDGVDLDHPDLQANIWVNRDEIPGNGVDDDGNGYIDDRFGWNTDDENNNLEGNGSHGTPVAGQIGARGNNGRGVTGVNWAVKLMVIRNNFVTFESEVIQAYSYALEARQRYDATDGREGAYVVATNASWGMDNGFPSQSPLWCALYDSLGTNGIINVAAAPNRNIDVETEGDLPSLCSSEYLVMVTNLNDLNERVNSAAFGAASIDLGAYGEGVYTTTVNGEYGTAAGTSYAAPAVTGTLGLLYSAPCPAFGELLLSDPAAAALLARDLVLTTVRPNASLSDITTTGGSLNAGGAMAALTEKCDDCFAPTSLTVVATANETDGLIVDWKVTASTRTTDIRIRVAGTTDWTTVNIDARPLRLSGLNACTLYEVQAIANCDNGSGATEIITTETRGCCRLPEDFRARLSGEGRSALVSWEPRLAATAYFLRYRATGSSEWAVITTTDTEVSIDSLERCTRYELELRTRCEDTATAYEGRLQLQTLGCGTCLDTEYCIPTGYDNSREWIARVSLPGVMDFSSGAAPDGFINYGDVGAAAVVPGGVYPIELVPEFLGNSFGEDFTVWIDWDQNGIFTRSDLAYSGSNARGSSAVGVITVPEDAKPGLTRMRVLMEFITRRQACPEGQKAGEGEDYCLPVAAVDGCPPPPFIEASYTEEEESTTLSWGASAAPGGEYRIRFRENNQEEYTELTVTGLTTTIAGTNLCESYEVLIASVCGGDPGGNRATYFGENCTDTDDPRIQPGAWRAFPNPVMSGGAVTLSWDAGLRVRQLELYAPTGQRLVARALTEGSTGITLPVGDFPAGIYLVRLQTHDGGWGVRRLVVR